MKGIDISNYSGIPTPEQLACIRGQGFDLLIAGTQRPEVTRPQLELARDAGFLLEAYVYLYWLTDTAQQVRQALQTIEGLPVRRLWLDCEDKAAALSTDQVLNAIHQAVEAAGTFPTGIYTGSWWWTPNTLDSTWFSEIPLWHAAYPLDTGPETPESELAQRFKGLPRYGGWTHPAMWQHQGSTELCGLNVDLNYLPDPEPGAAARPPDLDILFALASIGQFVRIGHDFKTLHPNDKAVIRWLQEQTR